MHSPCTDKVCFATHLTPLTGVVGASEELLEAMVRRIRDSGFVAYPRAVPRERGALDELLEATARRISDSASVAFPYAVSSWKDPPEEPLSRARTALSGCRSKGQSRSILMESDGP